MASKYLQKYPIPAGFQEILADLTREVLRDQPPNIIEYAALYFDMKEKGGKFQFKSQFNVQKEAKTNPQSYYPKNAEDITKKAARISNKLHQNQQHYQKQQPKHSATPVQHSQKSVNVQEVNTYMEQLNSNIQQNLDQKQLHQSANQQEADLQTAIEAIYMEFDQNNNGYLEGQQVRNFIAECARRLGVEEDSIPNQTMDAFIQDADINNDGRISKVEMFNFLINLFT